MERVVLTLAVAALSACNAIPGTSAYKIDHAQQEAAKNLIDPSSAQFRSVRVGKNGSVCGEINAKNRMGAYVGFSRWVAQSSPSQPSGWLAQVDPQFDPSEKASADDFCASLRSSGYSSASTIASACERAQEQSMNELMQRLFNESWQRNCQ